MVVAHHHPRSPTPTGGKASRVDTRGEAPALDRAHRRLGNREMGAAIDGLRGQGLAEAEGGSGALALVEAVRASSSVRLDGAAADDSALDAICQALGADAFQLAP